MASTKSADLNSCICVQSTIFSKIVERSFEKHANKTHVCRENIFSIMNTFPGFLWA